MVGFPLCSRATSRYVYGSISSYACRNLRHKVLIQRTRGVPPYATMIRAGKSHVVAPLASGHCRECTKYRQDLALKTKETQTTPRRDRGKRFPIPPNRATAVARNGRTHPLPYSSGAVPPLSACAARNWSNRASKRPPLIARLFA